MDRSRPKRSGVPARQRVTATHLAILRRLAAGELVEASTSHLSDSVWWESDKPPYERERISSTTWRTISNRGWVRTVKLKFPTAVYTISARGREVLDALNASVTPDSP